MPSVYTIEGTRRRRKTKKRRTAAQKRSDARMKRAAKICKRRSRKTGVDYRACMRKELTK